MGHLPTERQSDFQEICAMENDRRHECNAQYRLLISRMNLLDESIKTQQVEIAEQYVISNIIACRGTHRYKALAWCLGIIFGLFLSLSWLTVYHITQ